MHIGNRIPHRGCVHIYHKSPHYNSTSMSNHSQFDIELNRVYVKTFHIIQYNYLRLVKCLTLLSRLASIRLKLCELVAIYYLSNGWYSFRLYDLDWVASTERPCCMFNTPDRHHTGSMDNQGRNIKLVLRCNIKCMWFLSEHDHTS